jgi:hypothetical protein
MKFLRLSLLLCSPLFFGMVTAGCASRRNHPDISVRTAEDTVSLQRTADATTFRVTALLHNGGRLPVLVGGCGPTVERKLANGWRSVWRPICTSARARLLASGDSLNLPVGVIGWTKPNTDPQLDPAMIAGLYRLVFAVSAVAESTSVPKGHEFFATPSSTFVVVDAGSH